MKRSWEGVIRRGRKSERGQALAEFALTIPVLLMVILGGLELGRLAGTQMALWHASREGVRTVSIWGKDAEAVDTIKQSASWLDPSRITVTITPPEAERRTGDRVTVNVQYNFSFIIRSFWTDSTSLDSVLSAQVTGRVE